MMKRQIILSSLAILAACLTSPAQNASSLQTKSVSVFKNGQTFFIKSGSVNVQGNKWMLLEPAPAALYGTLWFHSPEGTLSRVSSYPDTLREKKQESAVAIYELLRANIGRNVSGFIDKEQTFAGKIVDVSPASLDEKGQPVYTNASIVTLADATLPDRWMTIPANLIRYMTFSQGKPNLQIEREKTKFQHRIELAFSNNKASQPLDMMYLANGMNWAPQYLLELNTEKTATLTLQSEVANDLEDLKDTELNLVVGVPNFQFANRMAYLVDFLSVISPVVRNYNYSNALATQTMAYDSDVAYNYAPPPPPVDFEGSSNEDLFFYTLKNFSLPKGGRSMQTIFRENVDIAHIYECQLPPNDENIGFFEEKFLFTPGQNLKVFHTVKAANNTRQPWTTASVLVMNKQGESRPISQDLLTYTPTGGNTFIKLTEAPDVKVEQAERELSRQRGAYNDKRRGIVLDLVQVEGKIKVNNYKMQSLDLRLQRMIAGTLKNSSVKWQKDEIVNPNNPVNRRAKVVWETAVKAQGELEIIYTYEVYVPGGY
jgi:hypothetical protein